MPPQSPRSPRSPPPRPQTLSYWALFQRWIRRFCRPPSSLESPLMYHGLPLLSDRMVDHGAARCSDGMSIEQFHALGGSFPYSQGSSETTSWLAGSKRRNITSQTGPICGTRNATRAAFPHPQDLVDSPSTLHSTDYHSRLSRPPPPPRQTYIMVATKRVPSARV